NARPEYGYHSAISPVHNASKWVQVDLGRAVAVDKIVLAPCHDTFNGIGAGFGFPVRYRVELSDDASFASSNFTLRHEDRDHPNPGTALQTFPTGGASGRYVRFTATRLAERQQDYILALAELQVLDTSGNNLASGRPVSALDAVEARPRWSRQNLVDGIAPGLAANPDPGALVSLQSRRTDLLVHRTPASLRQELDQAQEQLAEKTRQLAAMPAPQIVYAGTVHYGTGNFAGTGASGGTARVVHLLKRGDVKSPDQEMKPGPIAAFERQMGHYDCPNPADEGQRRAALARWISRPENPLLWRSIVNRVWQYHFGRGLVDTPNDFGRMGGVPSHPALLDWLAATFRDDLQGSMKGLHKLIVMSQAYRQSSDAPAEATATALKVDADNHLLWRQNRRKLEAEAVRDTILAVSGRLDLTIGGPSFQDFVVEKPEHSPHYQYHLHDPDDPRSHRRSIYRFIVRSQQQPFMTVLDCADPSMRVDKRNESLSPLQALAMLNNGLTVTMARHFAERVQAEVHGLSLEAQVSRAFTLALGRPPEVEELTTLSAHAAHHGLAGTCRVIMNLNEFTFVD
ncbi:MAG TPA: DUF1553 domain-containing protein, partial [Verrucomicrobium sp.]|nr:DUF1553 domain-containing protein [Verrucomicrobium sp.]